MINKKILIIFSIVIFSFLFVENSYAEIFSYNSDPIVLTWNEVTNALGFDTDQDGIIDTVYSSDGIGDATQTWTKIFGSGLSPITKTFTSSGTFVSADISAFPNNQIGVAIKTINGGCVAYYSVVNIFSNALVNVANSGSGTISGSNCFISSDYVKRSDNRYTFYSYFSNTGDTVCKITLNANTTVLTSTTQGGAYCTGSLPSALINLYGADPTWNTNMYFYDGQVLASTSVVNTGSIFVNDTASNTIKEVNYGGDFTRLIDKNATQYFSGIKRSNYYDSDYSVPLINTPLWSDILELYHTDAIPDSEKIFYVNWKILKSDLTVEPTIFPININGTDYIGLADNTNKKIYYALKPDISDYAFQRLLLDNYPPAILSTTVTTVLPSQTIALSTPSSTFNISQKGIIGLLSGSSLSPQSSVDRIIKADFLNLDNVLVHSIQPSTNTAVSVIVKNLPADYLIKIENPNLLGFGNYPIWSTIFVTADKSFSVDLPASHCFLVSTADASQDVKVWESLGTLCASGSMPKTITYSSNLSFTFWSLPYGVSHTFAQETETLQTKVRHDTFPFNYTVKIYDSSDVLAYTQEFNSTNEIDIQSINASGISRPALVKVFDIDNNQLYYATIGTPSYFSDSVAWFEEWLSIEGFNLLFMLPIVFSAMFTRNTVGIGTTITVVFIATLTWIGILPIPDNVIYFMIAIGIVGMIAHKKLYD